MRGGLRSSMNIEAVRGLARRWLGVGLVLALGVCVGAVITYLRHRAAQINARVRAEVRLRTAIRDYRIAEVRLSDEFADARRAAKENRRISERELGDVRRRLRAEAARSRDALAQTVTATFRRQPRP